MNLQCQQQGHYWQVQIESSTLMDLVFNHQYSPI